MRWAHSAVDYLAAAVGGAVVWGREMFDVGVVRQSLERVGRRWTVFHFEPYCFPSVLFSYY